MPQSVTSRYQQSTYTHMPAFQAPKKLVEEVVVKTITKQENNTEIFLTDAPDVDFDLLNEQSTQALKQQFEESDSKQEGL